jgi:hypothetical protein
VLYHLILILELNIPILLEDEKMVAKWNKFLIIMPIIIIPSDYLK